MSSQANPRTPLPVPNGWYAVAWCKDLVHGDVQRLQYFGRELVLFRSRSGRACVLDAHCPHLGAHLAEGGRVIGESVRCPFHGWQFDGSSGECVAIPYCKRIPPKARVRPWHVVERNHMIFVWHHADDEPPQWEVPTMPELADPDWTEPRYFQIEMPAHVQDLSENNCDPVHFHFVHTMTEIPESKIEIGADGRFFRISNSGTQVTPLGTFRTELERDTWQIGMNAVRTKGIPGAGLLMFASTSPIDTKRSLSRWIFTVTRNLADIAGEEFIKGMSTGVLQDLRIWENKIYQQDPVFCEADQELAHYRRWVKQFYSERA